MQVTPGMVALVLVSVLAFSMYIYTHEAGVEGVFDQVLIVACGDSYGTGWWLNSGYIITAYHVVDGCEPIAVRGLWAQKASIVAYDGENDIAVLRVDQAPPWARGLPLASNIALNQKVVVVGYPIQVYQETGNLTLASTQPRITEAVITWLHPTRPIAEYSPGTDAGNSGGPIVDAKSGGVVGIVVYARKGVVNEGFYMLRSDYIAWFLSNNGIEYSVVQDNGFSVVPVVAAAAAVLVVAAVARARG